MKPGETQDPQKPGARRSTGWILAFTLLGVTSAVTIVSLKIMKHVSDDVSLRSFEVRQIADSPHDPSAFTQGLVFHDGKLYESTGQYGESTLREIDPDTGEVLRRIDLSSRSFGEGLTLWNNQLIQLTWRERTAFVYDLETMNRNGEWKYRGEGWGLTHDGHHLILSDGSSTLKFLDPVSHAVTKRLRVIDRGRPVDKLNELEFVDGMILANVWYSDRIAQIDPETGEVIGWIDLSGLYPASQPRDREQVLNGIAWDESGRRLFVTGKNWPRMYQFSYRELTDNP